MKLIYELQLPRFSIPCLNKPIYVASIVYRVVCMYLSKISFLGVEKFLFQNISVPIFQIVIYMTREISKR